MTAAVPVSPFSPAVLFQSVPVTVADSSLFHALPAAAGSSVSFAATTAGVSCPPASPPAVAIFGSAASSALAIASPACSSFHSASPV